MLEVIVIGYVAALVAPFLYRMTGRGWPLVAALLPLSFFFWFIRFYPQVAAGMPVAERIPWVPSLGVELAFFLDGLSLTFALIITLVGATIFLYASGYMRHEAEAGMFWGWMTAFMTSMLGLVLADNLLLLFIFWELTSITSFMLIGFNHHEETSRKAALQALLVTGGGGLAMLGGFVLLGLAAGTFDLSALSALRGSIEWHPHYPAIVLLILLGAFTKSAQFPFHFWLPGAMAAPAPVSAYLHSATMVKAGIYLLARLNHELGGSLLWQGPIIATGAATMLFTAMLAFSQTDLKRLLAYATLSVLGTLVLLVGIGTPLAVKAFFIYLIAHSLYKATLFLVAGTLDHEAGTRDERLLGGLRRLMPASALTAVLASLSMMGVIPLVGFIGKETVYGAILEVEGIGLLLIAFAVLSNAFVVMLTIIAGFRPFLGELRPTPRKAHDPPLPMLVGPLLLAVLGLIGGLFPEALFSGLLDDVSVSLIAEGQAIGIALWHGFNLVLLLSFVTLLGGLALVFLRDRWLARAAALRVPAFLKPSAWYEGALLGLLRLARLQTLLVQNGYLRNYIIVIVLSALLLAVLSLSGATGPFLPLPPVRLTLYEVVLALIMTASTIMLVAASSRLNALVALGVLGFSVGVIFIIYGAPDLALTTFAIETLNVVLFVLVLARLPKFASLSSRSSRLRDGVIAALVGVFMTLVVLYATSFELQSELKAFFGGASLPLGKGRNVVNVILVDFRALDTLGEITVLAVAALGVLALLKTRPERSR